MAFGLSAWAAEALGAAPHCTGATRSARGDGQASKDAARTGGSHERKIQAQPVQPSCI